MRLLETLMAYSGGRRPLQETIKTSGHRYIQNAYDEEYAAYPEEIKRFLPAAHLLVRRDPQIRILEFVDKSVFQEKVAAAAYRMAKHSDDKGGIPDPASFINDKSRYGVPTGMREHLNEENSDVYVANLPEPTSSREIDHVRIMKVWSLEDGDQYLVRLDGNTIGHLSFGGLLSTLVSYGIPMEDAETMADEAKHFGTATYLTAYYDPADYD